MYDGENARRESINARCTTLLGVGGIIGALVVAAGQFGLNQRQGSLGVATWIVLVAFICSLLYIGAAIVMALNIQAAMQGNVVDPNDIPPASPVEGTPNGYNVKLAKSHLEYTIKNYKHNNDLKSKLVSAQRFLRNGIIAIIVAGIVSPWALPPSTRSTNSSVASTTTTTTKTAR